MVGNRYRELIGSLQYAALATRPDIAFAVNKLSQFLDNPGHVHLTARIHILRYLKGMKMQVLFLGGSVPDITGFWIQIGVETGMIGGDWCLCFSLGRWRYLLEDKEAELCRSLLH